MPLVYPLVFGVHGAETGLGGGVPPLGGFAEPAGRFGVVQRYSSAVTFGTEFSWSTGLHHRYALREPAENLPASPSVHRESHRRNERRGQGAPGRQHRHGMPLRNRVAGIRLNRLGGAFDGIQAPAAIAGANSVNGLFTPAKSNVTRNTLASSATLQSVTPPLREPLACD